MARPADEALAPSTRPILIGAAVFFGALTAAAGLMWTWFGTRLFFEMIATGIAYCF